MLQTQYFVLWKEPPADCHHLPAQVWLSLYTALSTVHHSLFTFEDYFLLLEFHLTSPHYLALYGQR